MLKPAAQHAGWLPTIRPTKKRNSLGRSDARQDGAQVGFEQPVHRVGWHAFQQAQVAEQRQELTLQAMGGEVVEPRQVALVKLPAPADSSSRPLVLDFTRGSRRQVRAAQQGAQAPGTHTSEMRTAGPTCHRMVCCSCLPPNMACPPASPPAAAWCAPRLRSSPSSGLYACRYSPHPPPHPDRR